MSNEDNSKKVVIIGAGPAGLFAAYKLIKDSDIKPVIFEDSEYIGGISRTHIYNGNRMDLGGHRFFTKNDEVMNLWKELFALQSAPAKDDILLNRDVKLSENGLDPEKNEEVFLKRRRLSRIYFLRKFFDYPISLKMKTICNLGFANLINAGFGYIYSNIFKRKENSLEDFYINRFGKPLYKMFFEDYTEKLWGIHPSEIAPDWGAQRVKGLSLFKILISAFLKIFGLNKNCETSLIEEFYYPKRGPGQLYEYVAGLIEKAGGKIYNNYKVTELFLDNNNISRVVATNNLTNESITVEASAVFSSMPVKDLCNAFTPNIDNNILDISSKLPYRDFITAGLLLKKFKIKNNSGIKTVSNIIPDCWIYIQERQVKLGRLQIFNNWSPYMPKDLENTVWMGLEYFCNEGDNLWNMSEKEFLDFASDELTQIGIIDKADVLDGTVVHVKKAYPAYFGSYSQFDKVKNYLNTINNLYCIGRNGQHKYNNMDHSILSALVAVKIFLNGENDKTQIWEVNTESEYHEAK